MAVEEFLKQKVLPQYMEIVEKLRCLIHDASPDVKETISYGILAFKKNRIIAVLNPTKNGITLAFSRGAEFDDKYGFLQGVGKVSKNLRFKSADEISEEAVRYYIQQALQKDAE